MGSFLFDYSMSINSRALRICNRLNLTGFLQLGSHVLTWLIFISIWEVLAIDVGQGRSFVTIPKLFTTGSNNSLPVDSIIRCHI